MLTIQEAEYELEKGAEMNPGPWKMHSISVAGLTFFGEMQGFCKVAARFLQGWRGRIEHVSKPDALRQRLTCAAF